MGDDSKVSFLLFLVAGSPRECLGCKATFKLKVRKDRAVCISSGIEREATILPSSTLEDQKKKIYIYSFAPLFSLKLVA